MAYVYIVTEPSEGKGEPPVVTVFDNEESAKTFAQSENATIDRKFINLAVPKRRMCYRVEYTPLKGVLRYAVTPEVDTGIKVSSHFDDKTHAYVVRGHVPQSVRILLIWGSGITRVPGELDG